MAKILGQHIPAEMKNLAINGALDFWQRVEGNTTTINDASVHLPYLADMVQVQSNGTTSKNYSVVRSTTVPTLAQSGFQSTYSWLFTMITGIASPATTDYVSPFSYRMEGLDYEKIHTKTVTFGFWAQASVAGTYNFALLNAAATRSYVTTFTINGANSWQFVPITVQMDNTGTWQFDNTFSLGVFIGVNGGSTYQTSTLGSWQAGALYASTTATNWQATSGATLQIAQFSMVEGPLGLGATGFARAGKGIQQELAMCQRYYEKSYDIGVALATATTSGMAAGGMLATGNWGYFHIYFKTTKRSVPGSLSYWDASGTASRLSIVTAAGDARNDGNNSSVNIGTQENGAYFGWDNATGAGQSPLVHWAADSGL